MSRQAIDIHMLKSQTKTEPYQVPLSLFKDKSMIPVSKFWPSSQIASRSTTMAMQNQASPSLTCEHLTNSSSRRIARAPQPPLRSVSRHLNNPNHQVPQTSRELLREALTWHRQPHSQIMMRVVLILQETLREATTQKHFRCET